MRFLFSILYLYMIRTRKERFCWSIYKQARYRWK